MNIALFILAAAGCLWGLAVFLGFITGTAKVFHKTPSAVSEQSQQAKDQGQESAEEARQRQKELMDSLKQKMSDHRR